MESQETKNQTDAAQEGAGQTTGNAGVAPIQINEPNSGIEALKELLKDDDELELENGDRQYTLPSGSIAVYKKFKGRHVKQLQRLGVFDKKDSTEDEIMYAMIAVCTTIDGHGIVIEDTDDLPGMDLISLMGKFTAANFR